MKVLNFAAAASVAIIAMGSTVAAAPLSFIDLGLIGEAGSYDFDTTGSVFQLGSSTSGNVDTELGIWDASGTLLAQNDDGGTGFFSRILIDLTAGTYFVGISEFNTIFTDNFLNRLTGFESGEIADLILNIDGVQLGLFEGASDQLDQETAFFQISVGDVSVVPLPAALPLLGGGIALMGFMGWRRKRAVA